MSENHPPPPPLAKHLANIAYKDLRGMATRLGLRQRQQQHKTDWQTALGGGWQDAALRQHWLAQLSPAARAALQRLQQAEQIPAALFWATYGLVRQVTAHQHWQPPPWQAPATVSEELYYSALLAPADAPTIGRARWLTLPAEIHALLAPTDKETDRQGDKETRRPEDKGTTASLTTASLTTASLCHDLAHFLIYLHSHPKLRLQQGRWLTRTDVAKLNERFYQPLTGQPLPTHRRSAYLRLLGFLAAAGELSAQGALTPKGWAWLADDAHTQLAWLWQSWRQAAPVQRQAYHLPAATVSLPWPQPLVQQLQATPVATPFTVADLVHGLFRHQRASAAFWAANFHDLADLEELLSQTLTEVLQPLGLVEARPAQHYQISRSGATLLHPPSPPPTPLSTDSLSTDSLATAPLTTDPLLPGFALDLPAWPSVWAAQAQLARYAHYVRPPARSRQRYHRYQLTPATLAHAAAAGYALPPLHAALISLGYTLPPEQYQQLSTWHAAGQQFVLTQLPLLRTTTAAQLAALYQDHTLRPLLSEILSPTVAVVNTDLPTLAHRLAQQGYHATQPQPPPPADQGTGQNAALWLAGRLYAQLAAHLPVPLPPPFAELDRLFAALSPAQQAVLQAQAAQLHDHLLQLLDNLPFTPPPHPSDPAHWRPLLEQASAAQQRLQLTYFSAGRNLTTQRLIEPYWLEEYHHTPYLRAYCHSAGRVLTFRLDRIMALAVEA